MQVIGGDASVDDNLNRTWWIMAAIILVLTVLIPLWASIKESYKGQIEIYRNSDVRYEQVINND